MLKPINGYEGLYSVTADGRVWSHYTRRWLRPGVRSDGYEIVILYRDGMQSNGVVHRLVAEAWVGRPSGEKLEVNHIDGNKLHNSSSNLEWVTRKQNVAHAIANGLMTPSPEAAKRLGIAARKITVEDARIIRAEYARGTRQNALARRFGISASTVQNIIKGRRYVAAI